MEFKRLITQFTYRIEPKPEGGFIAHASDPNVPPLEAPTREELQQKIQANIMSGLAAQFPALQVPLQNQGTKFSFHIESNPAGGFALHSGDPGTQPVEGTQEQIESHFAEKLIGLAEKFSPELRQALASQGASGDVKVFVNKKTFTVKGGSHALSMSLGPDFLPTVATQSNDGAMEATKSGVDAASMGGTIGDSPILAERSGSGSIFLFLLTILVVGTLVYFLFFHR